MADGAQTTTIHPTPTTVQTVTRRRTERRTVTVLFVDMVGFTSLAADLEPEQVYALQTVYFDTVAEVIRRWNGVVEKYIGDAVMAVFGLTGPDGDTGRDGDAGPDGDTGLDGDHAYRAVRAGGQILARVRDRRFPHGLPVSVRVGVATGVVVVDPAARDGDHGFVCGSVVNMAARVQAHAAEGTVAVTAATRTATGGRIRYRRLSPVRAAGIRDCLELWRPIGTVDGRPVTRIEWRRLTTDVGWVTASRVPRPRLRLHAALPVCAAAGQPDPAGRPWRRSHRTRPLGPVHRHRSLATTALCSPWPRFSDNRRNCLTTGPLVAPKAGESVRPGRQGIYRPPAGRHRAPGRVVEIGTHQSLIATGGSFVRLWPARSSGHGWHLPLATDPAH